MLLLPLPLVLPLLLKACGDGPECVVGVHNSICIFSIRIIKREKKTYQGAQAQLSFTSLPLVSSHASVVSIPSRRCSRLSLQYPLVQ